MMKFVTLTLLCLGFASLNAQNLVPNSSFEEKSSCPLKYGELWRANPWFRPTEGTSDYFNACDTSYVGKRITAGVPNNFFGYQEAHSGEAYVGICLNTYSNSYREYVEVKLTHPLQAKTKYNVSFFYSAADSAKMAVKSFGVCFTPDSLLQSGYRNFHIIPQVTYQGDFIADTSQWMFFSKSFTASGGENYLVLGNFKDQAQTEITYLSSITSPTFNIAYIYIDDISVSEDTSTVIEDIPAIKSVNSDFFSLQPTVTMGEITLSYYPGKPGSEMDLRIFNLFGQEVSQSTLYGGKTVFQTGSWSAGYYFFKARSEYLQKEGKFLLVK